MSQAPRGVEELVVEVGAPAHGGHCVARPAGDPHGRVIFVRHALPGETVRASLTHTDSRVWRADAVEVLQASADRVESVWPEAGPAGVGGGELGHVALSAQRTWKQWVLVDCLRRIGGQGVADAVAAAAGREGLRDLRVEPMPSEAAAQSSNEARIRALAGTGSRTRVSLTATRDGRAGMHAHRSSTVLAVHRLPLAVPRIQDLDLTGRSRWRHHLFPGARLSAVAPSAGDPVVLVDGRVLTASGRSTQRRRVEELVDASELGLGMLRYCVHADGFWQVHADAPRVLVDRVVRAVLERVDAAQGTRVLELYSGAGLLTVPLAQLGCQIRSLEGSGQAVRDARRNLHDQRSARLFQGRVTAAAVGELGSGFGAAGDEPADVVVLDPPRKGAGREVCRAVVELAPRVIVLVACDPAALARDLATVVDSGYRLSAISALDMFPHTHHLETVAVAQRL